MDVASNGHIKRHRSTAEEANDGCHPHLGGGGLGGGGLGGGDRGGGGLGLVGGGLVIRHIK